MPIKEQDLCFNFGAAWRETVRKLEGHADYERLSSFGVNTVDLIGIQQDTLYLIEVKDYRIVTNETDVLTPKELSEWIANKVTGTLLCFYLSKTRYRSNAWNDFVQFLSDSAKNIQVVAWIEMGNLTTVPSHRTVELQRKTALQSFLMTTLKSRFGKWRKSDPNINWPIIIFASGAHPLPDLTVQDLRVNPAPCP